MKNLFRYYVRHKKQTHSAFWLRLILPVVGLFALVWFLIRVIPKPSRATYPCQRIAFPLASAFVIWLIGIFASVHFVRRAGRLFSQKRRWVGTICLAVSVLILWTALSVTSQRKARADEPIRNDPVGVAKGIFPGRVVWVHDPNATDWDQAAGTYSWQDEHTSQKHVDAMVAKAVRQLTGCDTDAAAWDALFRHFNTEHGKGDVGYSPGEKITIKANLTTCNHRLAGWTIDAATYQKQAYLDKSDTNPQVIVALLRQLVFKAGVEPNAIAVGDTLAYFPNQWWDICHDEFPNVIYFGYGGLHGRVQSVASPVRQYWSDPNLPVVDANDFIPALYAEADYQINLPVLKSHGSGGITLNAKNHYGSYNRTPDDAAFYPLHPSLAANATQTPQYRALVDIMGHPHMGGKTLLYMIDGLYGGQKWQGTPEKFLQEPFYNDWPSSILVSQDPVAADCVGMDILWDEWPETVQISAVDDYLLEAAQADAPPSGTFYDPDGDGTALASLGVYERWNNATDRQYSRNLDPINGTGIELVYIKMTTHRGDLNSDGTVEGIDLIQLADQWLWLGQPGQIREDISEDGSVNLDDFRILSTQWGTVAD